MWLVSQFPISGWLNGASLVIEVRPYGLYVAKEHSQADKCQMTGCYKLSWPYCYTTVQTYMPVFYFSAYGFGYWLWCDDEAAERSSVFIPVNHDDITDQSDGSLENSEISTQLVVAKLTSIDVYQEDLSLLEESVKVAVTHEAISVFKQFYGE